MKNLIINLFNKLRHVPSQDMSELVIVIFGGSGKIGSVVANYFIERGARIALFGRDTNKLRSVIDLNSKDKVLLHEGDILNEKEIYLFFEKTNRTFGKINAVVNTVGEFSELKIDEISSKSIDQMCNSNFKSVVIPSKVALSILEKGTTVVNFGSYIVNNKKVGSGKALYLAFKSALDGFSRVFSVEAKKKGIRVVCLEPATVSNFVTKDFLKYINPNTLAEMIEFILKFKNIDFGTMPFKSINQDNI